MMKFSFIPKEKVFYELLETLALKAKEAVKLFGASIQSWSGAHPGVQELRDAEHVCDRLVHQIMLRLNKTFITPIDGEDIHNLAKTLDDLVDIVHAVSERLVLFRIEKVSDDFKEMTTILERSTEVVFSLVQKIAEIKDAPAILELCDQVGILEKQGDRIFELSLGKLFQNSPDPLEVIKWKEIYESLEEATDKCEDIADIIEGIVVKYG